MAVARHPVARTAPPAPAIISASRARVGERDGQRGPPHRIVETGWLSRATPWLASRRRRSPSSAPRAREWGAIKVKKEFKRLRRAIVVLLEIDDFAGRTYHRDTHRLLPITFRRLRGRCCDDLLGGIEIDCFGGGFTVSGTPPLGLCGSGGSCAKSPELINCATRLAPATKRRISYSYKILQALPQSAVGPRSIVSSGHRRRMIH